MVVFDSLDCNQRELQGHSWFDMNMDTVASNEFVYSLVAISVLRIAHSMLL